MSDELQSNVGLAIRKRRLENGLSQEAFAEVVGVHRTYMGSVERGERNISLQNLVRIAAALRIPVSRLIAEAEQLPTIRRGRGPRSRVKHG